MLLINFDISLLQDILIKCQVIDHVLHLKPTTVLGGTAFVIVTLGIIVSFSDKLGKFLVRAGAAGSTYLGVKEAIKDGQELIKNIKSNNPPDSDVNTPVESVIKESNKGSSKTNYEPIIF